MPILVYSTRRLAGGALRSRSVGGFADRMKGIVSLYLLALATDRAFFIDWAGPGRLQDNFTPAHVPWIPPEGLFAPARLGEFANIDLIGGGLTKDRRATIRAGDIEAGLFGNAAHVWCQNNHFLYRDLSTGRLAGKVLRCGIDLRSQETCFRSAADMLFEYRPAAEIQALLDEFLAWKAAPPRVVGVQIRTGGDGDWPDSRMLEAVHWGPVCRDVAGRLRSRPAGTGVFIATDSPRFKEMLAQTIAPAFPVWSLQGSIVHLERSDGAALDEAWDLVVLENTILSRCDEILTGKGGFGKVAAWRAGIAPTVLV